MEGLTFNLDFVLPVRTVIGVHNRVCDRFGNGIEANPRRWVVGLREGCILHYENEHLELIGERPMRIFRKGQPIREVVAGDDLSFLFNK